MMNTVLFRFYQELNDFLPPEKRKQSFQFRFTGNPAVKDSIESLGVPHTEVDLILVNGRSVDFYYQLQDGDRIAVYPVFESIDIREITRLRPYPLRETKFILDVHLGALARMLRMLGFDSKYENSYKDPQIVDIALAEGRIILTRDRGLLKRRRVTHGYCVRSDDPDSQVQEIVKRFDLYASIQPLARCIACNGLIYPVSKDEVKDRLKPKTKEFYRHFYRCSGCGKIYWKGSHFRNILDKIAGITNNRCNI
jgi:hypothetical protein